MLTNCSPPSRDASQRALRAYTENLLFSVQYGDLGALSGNAFKIE